MTEIDQCLREIARCEEYLRAGGAEEMAGALQGLQDWTGELALLRAADIEWQFQPGGCLVSGSLMGK